MHMNRVEVDDEVFSFVKTNAEPLVDTFNSALRRLLPLGKLSKGAGAISNARASQLGVPQIPPLPTGTPEALRQILEVISLVCSGAYDRRAASQFVAKHRNIFPQTVLDKYCRQLQLTASQFDRLLEQDGLVGLRRILKSKFPSHDNIIDDAIGIANKKV